MPSPVDMHDLRRRWDESCRGGTALSAEQLCQNCPELLEQVGQLLPHWAAEPAASPDPSTWSLRPDSEHSKFPPSTPPIVSLIVGLELVPGYCLTRPLGKGAFGEVWEATGPGAVRLALKVLPLQGAAPTTELRALEFMKDVRHPHLLALSAYWQLDSLLVIAMELAEDTLWHRLQDCRNRGLSGIPAEELRVYLHDAADAIDFLNGARTTDGKSRPGIQHRDIKPANLLLVGGRVKVGDFGLAKLLDQNVGPHSGAMTVSYAAPECFHNQTTHFSDQYSLAATYCQLRGGRLPFEGPPAAVMAGHLQGSPDLSMLPLAERVVVARALAKKPEERWPSCRAFVKALDEASSKAAAAAEIDAPAPGPVSAKKIRPVVVAILSAVMAPLFIVESIEHWNRLGRFAGTAEFVVWPAILLGLCFFVLAWMGLKAAWRRTAYYYSGLLCALTIFLWAPGAALTAALGGNDGLLGFIAGLTVLSMAMLYYLSKRTIADAGSPRDLPRRPASWPRRALVLGVLLLPVFAAGFVEFAKREHHESFVITLIPLLAVNGLYLLLPAARCNRTHWLPISFAVVPCLIAATFLVGYAQPPKLPVPMFNNAPANRLPGSYHGRFIIGGQPSDVIYNFEEDGRLRLERLNGGVASFGRWRWYEALYEVEIDWDDGSFERARVFWIDHWTMEYRIVMHRDNRQIGLTTTFKRQ